MKKTVCIDLDGVLAEYDGWKGEHHIGDPIPGALLFVQALSEFAHVVVYTARTDLNAVAEWLKMHLFPADMYVGNGKPKASAYVDDRAVICRPDKDPENYDFDRALRECRALTKNVFLGSQGTYSDGKIDEEDEGDMHFMISRQNGCVRLDFGKPVGWMALPKQHALQLAATLLKHANEL